MVQILYRYRILFLLIGLAAALLAVGVVLFRSSSYKIPSRGVFVLEQHLDIPDYTVPASNYDRILGGIV